MAESLGPTIEQARSKTLDILCDHFANDVLTLEEFERRVDVAHASVDPIELTSLLADLPAAAAPKVAGEVVVESPPRHQIEAPLPSQVEARRTIFSVFGAVKRSGRWIPARANTAVVLFAGAELDFRNAMLAPGITEVYSVAVFGGVEIIVPPGVQVECDGVAIFGGFEQKSDDFESHTDPSQPIIRVRGLALFGGVEVSVRHPGESVGEARRRRRLEKKERRRRLKSGEG